LLKLQKEWGLKLGYNIMFIIEEVP